MTPAATGNGPVVANGDANGLSPTSNWLSEVRGVVAQNADEYVSKLSEAVRIASVSSRLDMRKQCHDMAALLHQWIIEMGGTSEKVLIGFQELEDGTRFDLPPVILASFGRYDRTKPTLLVYAHYDVLAAEKDDEGWTQNPFELTEKDGNLFGRGTTSNKGPILAWLWAVDTMKKMGRELPVNLKFIFEGMQESRSECLQDLLQREVRRGGFLVGVDYVVVTDNYCLNGTKPCLTYGVRGLVSFEVDVHAGEKTLNSGLYAGAIHEPMTDLVQLLAAVSAGAHDDIDVLGCGRDAADPRTEAEDALYRGITFDPAEFRNQAGGVRTLKGGEDLREILMNRWRYPALSIHGIEPYNAQGSNPVIPGSVTGKFSIRLVPGQDTEVVEREVRATLEQRFKQMKSPSKLTVTSSASRPWLADPKGTLFTAGAAALLRVHGVRPDLTREGGSIPVVTMLADVIDAELMLLPLGASDDAEKSHNEKIGKSQFLTAVTSLCALLDEVAQAHARRDDLPKAKGAFGRIRDIWYGLS